MKIATYEYKGRFNAGIVSDASMLHELRDPDGGVSFTSLDEILSKGKTLEQIYVDIPTDEREAIPLASVRLLAPVLYPEKIYLAAVNYTSHSKEHPKEAVAPSEPYFFTKFRNALIGTGEPILIPKISTAVDWEVELAVIIGKKGKNIPKEEAMNYVAGYTISNDVSFRDRQFPSGWPKILNSQGQNWVKGKGLDNSLPLGPWLVTKDEIPDIYDCKISLSVNGVKRQESKIGEMIFKIDTLIEYLSAGVTLLPGDIVSTGTPLGVAAFTGAPYLKAGDLVEASIENIGVLRNPVKSEN